MESVRAGTKIAEEVITAVDGKPLLPESRRMLEYLRDRARTLRKDEIIKRILAAALELEHVVASVDENDIRRLPSFGKWHVADVVDHISQSQARGAEELRMLLAGRRPPGPPVYEALKSGASEWASWADLQEGLKGANREMLAVIDSCTAEQDNHQFSPLTVRTVVVANCKLPDGRITPQIYFAELGWKEYALLQRLHLLDHRTQVRRIVKSLAESCVEEALVAPAMRSQLGVAVSKK